MKNWEEKIKDFLSVYFFGYTVRFCFVGTGKRLKKRFSKFFLLFSNRGKSSDIKKEKSIIIKDHKQTTFMFAIRKALLFFINELKKNPNIVIFHGAAVCKKDGIIFCFLGKQGSGKSTSCKIFTRAGFKLISEDTLFLDIAKGEFITFPKPVMLKGRSGKIREILITHPAEPRVRPKLVLAILLLRRIKGYGDFKSFVEKMNMLARYGVSSIDRSLSNRSNFYCYLQRIGEGEGIGFLIRQVYNFDFINKEKFLRFVSRWKFLKLL